MFRKKMLMALSLLCVPVVTFGQEGLKQTEDEGQITWSPEEQERLAWLRSGFDAINQLKGSFDTILQTGLTVENSKDFVKSVELYDKSKEFINQLKDEATDDCVLKALKDKSTGFSDYSFIDHQAFFSRYGGIVDIFTDCDKKINKIEAVQGHDARWFVQFDNFSNDFYRNDQGQLEFKNAISKDFFYDTLKKYDDRRSEVEKIKQVLSGAKRYQNDSSLFKVLDEGVNKIEQMEFVKQYRAQQTQGNHVDDNVGLVEPKQSLTDEKLLNEQQDDVRNNSTHELNFLPPLDPEMEKVHTAVADQYTKLEQEVKALSILHPFKLWKIKQAAEKGKADILNFHDGDERFFNIALKLRYNDIVELAMYKWKMGVAVIATGVTATAAVCLAAYNKWVAKKKTDEKSNEQEVVQTV